MRKTNVCIDCILYAFIQLFLNLQNIIFHLNSPTVRVIVESGLFCTCGALRTEQN